MASLGKRIRIAVLVAAVSAAVPFASSAASDHAPFVGLLVQYPLNPETGQCVDLSLGFQDVEIPASPVLVFVVVEDDQVMGTHSGSGVFHFADLTFQFVAIVGLLLDQSVNAAVLETPSAVCVAPVIV